MRWKRRKWSQSRYWVTVDHPSYSINSQNMAYVQGMGTKSPWSTQRFWGTSAVLILAGISRFRGWGSDRFFPVRFENNRPTSHNYSWQRLLPQYADWENNFDGGVDFWSNFFLFYAINKTPNKELQRQKNSRHCPLRKNVSKYAFCVLSNEIRTARFVVIYF